MRFSSLVHKTTIIMRIDFFYSNFDGLYCYIQLCCAFYKSFSYLYSTIFAKYALLIWFDCVNFLLYFELYFLYKWAFMFMFINNILFIKTFLPYCHVFICNYGSTWLSGEIIKRGVVVNSGQWKLMVCTLLKSHWSI